MNEIIQERYGSFLKNVKKLSYTLNDNQLFSLNQYKICNNQTQDLFTKCQKIQHNGKVRILYFIEEYENVLDTVKEINESDYYKICENLIYAMMQIKDNSFLDVHNVVLEPDLIYVEKETLKVKLVYVPVSIVPESVIEIDNDIKNVLIKITNVDLYPELWAVIKSSDLEQIQRWLQKERKIRETGKAKNQLVDVEGSEIDYKSQLEKSEIQNEKQHGKQRKSWKIIAGVITVMVFGIGITCYVVGLSNGKAQKMFSNPEPTATSTPKPTATQTPEPTATPTPELTATPIPELTATPIPEPTTMPKRKQKRQPPTEMSIQNNPVQNNPAPPQTQQSAEASSEQNNGQEEGVEESYGDIDEFIIVE